MMFKSIVFFAASVAIASAATTENAQGVAFANFDASNIVRRAEDGSCSKDSQCKKFGKNVGCNDKVCTCNPGYYVGKKGTCEKVTEKICTKFCQDKVDSDSECLDVKKGTCKCTKKGEALNSSGTKCVKYTRDQCDKDCRALYGKNFECAPKLDACAKKN
jgi:hypothetical protein